MAETRRDRWGRYLIVPPASQKPIGYTRVTTIAKTLDDGGGLIPWKATATMVGALRRPGLMARWQALMAEHPDPWYASPDSKTTAKKLVEDCATAGGSSDRAEVGTALHAILEQQLRGGGATPILQPGMQADIDAFTRTIAAAGITFNHDLIEAIVVNDTYQFAGTADQLEAHLPGHGAVVSDLKTGADLKYSWQAIAIQLAAYANADAVYRQGDANDGTQDTRHPMPNLSKEVGLVIHLPAGEGRCDLYLLDLVAGQEALLMSLKTRGWRQRKDLANTYKIAAPALPLDGTPSPGAVIPSTAATPEPGPVQPSTTTTPPPFDDVPPAPATAPSTVTELPPFDDSPPASPEPAPSSPATFNLTEAQQARKAIDIAADQRRHLLEHANPDEGNPADTNTLGIAERDYQALDVDDRTWITALAKDAIANNVSFHVKDTKTVRRFEILRGLLILCRNQFADDEIARAVLEHVIGAPAHYQAVPTGALIGSLSAAEARQFADRCDEFVAGRYVPVIRDGGLFTLRPAA